MNCKVISSRLPNCIVVLLLLGTLLLQCPGYVFAEEQARPNAPANLSASFDEIKTSLDEAETAIGREDASAESLVEIREKLNETAAKLREQLGEIEPRAAEIEERLKQLGPPPPKDGPAESEQIAEEREQLTTSSTELDGALKQGRLLLLRVEQLNERISGKRHALYARELFAQTQSILDPFFWRDAFAAISVEWRRLDGLIASWQMSVGERLDGLHLFGAVLSVIGIALFAFFVSRWLSPLDDTSLYETESGRAWKALRVFIWLALPPSLTALVAFLLLGFLGILTNRVEPIAQALVVGVAVAALGRAVAVSLFALDHPARRLVPLDLRLAAVLHSFFVWSTAALGLTIVLQAIHKASLAPLVITVATNALFAAVTVALLALLIFRLGRLKRMHAVGLAAVQWLHPLAILMAGIMIGALVLGFASFAAFLGLRVIVAAVAFGALYLFLEVTKAIFSASNEASPRGQALADHLGLTVAGLGLIGTVVSGAIRLLLVALSFFVIIGPWEISTSDLFDTISNVPFGFKIGEIHVSFRTILGSLVLLIGLILLTRLARRWLENEFLPRTKIEPSLQQSIATIFGYVGVIAAIALALGTLGIDLQKVALIAGALSVGIGFGLQSIVSNFVSGLILLAERPIRVGDAIVVKGEEGWVRRVRVRATEIETYDRASVIIPNSELITGMVKNWTRANTLGRIVVKVGVAYGSDPEKVAEILKAIAVAHPNIVQAPPPGVFLLGLGDSALEFELRCIVANVESGLSVKSDLYFAILKRFNAAGIEIPFPQREVRLRNVPPDAAAVMTVS